MSKLTTIMYNLTPDEGAEGNISRLTEGQAEAIELACIKEFLARAKKVLIFKTKGQHYSDSGDSISRREAVDDLMNEFLELNIH